MKIPYFFIFSFFCFSFAFSQNIKAEQADALASEKNYTAEIALRKEIMASMGDTISDSYKEQAYKTKYAKNFLVSDLNKAASFIEAAIAIFGTMENQSAREKVIMDIEYSYVLVAIGQGEKAWEVASRAYKLALEEDTQTDSYQKEIALLLKQFAHIKWFMQDYEAAIGYFKQALEKNIQLYGYYSMMAGDICRFLSIVYSFTPDFNAQMEYGLKAQEIYEHIQPENKFILFRQYSNNFKVFKEYGNMGKATELIQKITAYYETNKNDNVFMYGNYQNFPNLNAVKTTYYYKKLQYAAAIFDSLQAEHYYDLFQQTLPKRPVSYSKMELNSIVKYNLETGFMFQLAGNYGKAKKYYLEAEKFSESNAYSFGVLQSYWVLTTLGVKFQKWDDVVLYAEKALNHPDIEKFNSTSTIRHNLAYAFYGKKQYEEALAALTKELDGYLNAPESLNDFRIQQNLIEIGTILVEMYQEKPQTSYLEKAWQAYRQASVIFSRLYRSGKFNDQLAKFQNSISQGMLNCAYLLDDHQAEALAQVEMNTSDYLWSNFLSHQKNFPKDPLHLESQLDSLIDIKNNFESQLKIPELTVAQKDSLTAQTAKAETKIASLRKEIKESPLPYYRFSKNNFQLEQLQAGMEEGEMAIKYILADSLVFAYGITKNNLHLEKLPTNKDSLHQKMTGYLTSIKNIREDYREKAEGLYTVLIAPMKPTKHSKITIIPDGFLGYLPFETLIGTNGDFLVQNHAVAYAASLKLWDIQKNMPENPSNELGVFSPKYNLQLAATMPDTAIQTLVRSGNYELAGARKEAKKINALFGGKLFISESATKDNFIKNAENYDMLHLAMHAVLDENEPEKSNLIFSNNEKLYLSELYNLNLPTKLVVLSACNTGTGKIKNGEGVQSLSRAFTYAGVKSTVRSLWPVPDRETAQIMTSFYQNLKKGGDKSFALRKAKLDYLEKTTNKTLRHPYYWAGFVVSGDTSPITSPISYWWYVLGVAVVLGGAVFLVRRRKNNSEAA